jgi:hypothetical protein
MNGFLHRLVERHGAEPVTRPRALSHFEVDVPPHREPPAEAIRRLSSPGDPRRVIVSGEASPSAPATAAGAVSRRGPDEFHPFAGPPREAFRSESPVGPSENPAGESSGDRPSRSPGSPTAPNHGVEPPAGRIPAPAPSREAGPIVPRRPPVAAPAALPVRERARGGAGDLRREPDVVRVHIGRVDVRAVLPPAERPAPNPPGATGPLPLDRYLARKGRP